MKAIMSMDCFVPCAAFAAIYVTALFLMLILRACAKCYMMKLLYFRISTENKNEDADDAESYPRSYRISAGDNDPYQKMLNYKLRQSLLFGRLADVFLVLFINACATLVLLNINVILGVVVSIIVTMGAVLSGASKIYTSKANEAARFDIQVDVEKEK